MQQAHPPAAHSPAAQPPAATPKTRKGRSSKEALLAAARSVFGRDGYAAARVSDIAAGAGLSNGAFYWYYRDKREVLIELLRRVLAQLFEQSRSPWRPESPTESVRATTEHYLRFYRANADLFRVLHETVQTDPDVEAMQNATRRQFHERIARMITRGIDRGAIRPTLDPELGAALLGGMTEHYAYTRYVLRRYPDRAIGEVSDELTQLWAHGALTEAASGTWPEASGDGRGSAAERLPGERRAHGARGGNADDVE